MSQLRSQRCDLASGVRVRDGAFPWEKIQGSLIVSLNLESLLMTIHWVEMMNSDVKKQRTCWLHGIAWHFRRALAQAEERLKGRARAICWWYEGHRTTGGALSHIMIHCTRRKLKIYAKGLEEPVSVWIAVFNWFNYSTCIYSRQSTVLHRCVGVSRNEMNEIATRIVIVRVLNSLIYERRFCLDTFSNSLETCLKELWTHWLPWSHQAPAPHPRRVEGVARYRHFFFNLLVRTDFGNPF